MAKKKVARKPAKRKTAVKKVRKYNNGGTTGTPTKKKPVPRKPKPEIAVYMVKESRNKPAREVTRAEFNAYKGNGAKFRFKKDPKTGRPMTSEGRFLRQKYTPLKRGGKK